MQKADESCDELVDDTSTRSSTTEGGYGGCRDQLRDLRILELASVSELVSGSVMTRIEEMSQALGANLGVELGV
jgi:hypothetical protein